MHLLVDSTGLVITRFISTFLDRLFAEFEILLEFCSPNQCINGADENQRT